MTNPEAIATITGAVSSIHKTLLSGNGYSDATLEHIDVKLTSGSTKSFILKYIRLNSDWLSQRTKDTVGREAAILDEDSLLGIWESVGCPYVAFAMGKGKIACSDKRNTLLLKDYYCHTQINKYEKINLHITSSINSFCFL